NAASRISICKEARRVLKRGGTMLIADFAAHNEGIGRIGLLLVHVIEWIAGHEHYSNFRSTIQQGGIVNLLKNLGLQVEQLSFFLADTIAVAAAYNNKAE